MLPRAGGLAPVSPSLLLISRVWESLVQDPGQGWCAWASSPPGTWQPKAFHGVLAGEARKDVAQSLFRHGWAQVNGVSSVPSSWKAPRSKPLYP